MIINLIHKLLPTVFNRPAIFEVSKLFKRNYFERMTSREFTVTMVDATGVICAAWYCVMKKTFQASGALSARRSNNGDITRDILLGSHGSQNCQNG